MLLVFKTWLRGFWQAMLAKMASESLMTENNNSTAHLQHKTHTWGVGVPDWSTFTCCRSGKLLQIKTQFPAKHLIWLYGISGSSKREPVLALMCVSLCSAGEEGLDPLMCHSWNWQTISHNPVTQCTAFLNSMKRYDSQGGRETDWGRERERERESKAEKYNFSKANVYI